MCPETRPAETRAPSCSRWPAEFPADQEWPRRPAGSGSHCPAHTSPRRPNWEIHPAQIRWTENSRRDHAYLSCWSVCAQKQSHPPAPPDAGSCPRPSFRSAHVVGNDTVDAQDFPPVPETSHSAPRASAVRPDESVRAYSPTFPADYTLPHKTPPGHSELAADDVPVAPRAAAPDPRPDATVRPPSSPVPAAGAAAQYCSVTKPSGLENHVAPVGPVPHA